MTVPKEEKIIGFLKIAAKSNGIVYGKIGIRNYLKSNKKKKLILLPIDVGERVKKDVLKRCEIFKVSYIEIKKTKYEISKIIGKENISVIGITNESLAEAILGEISDDGGGS
ncbi:50S ribosomal protein L7ae family protein [Petrotoga sp. 9PWA.NaAc.5.4]|uniref:L7Ae/L30e/S12e/Gadd45 family ribosomal protein n=1 Tax=Petrotoga sp. 9PWA.NaAc.5.4 TaxID=1434328 RepID=UPI000CAB9107|nr:50S ribosomal protein L7ae family protein [Petrotoga sp. 9PWA.NaAc.5.4]PNR94827.1 50S ribosomal protein L7 [Petrotoga sp. 9PWA.NaAc.5.4]